MDLDLMTTSDFENLTEDEQEDIIKQLTQKLGGSELDLKLYCPKEVKEWWEGRARDMVRGGVISVQLLMSHFFLAILKNSLSNSPSGFDEKVTVALAILRGDVELKYKDGLTDTPDMGVESNEDDSKKTYH